MENQMYHYATVSKALEELANKGYTIDYNIKDADIISNPDTFEIQHIYRYEGESDPADEATVYGLKCTNGDKGVFVAGNSTYEETDAAMILHEISIKGRDDK